MRAIFYFILPSLLTLSRCKYENVRHLNTSHYTKTCSTILYSDSYSYSNSNHQLTFEIHYITNYPIFLNSLEIYTFILLLQCRC